MENHEDFHVEDRSRGGRFHRLVVLFSYLHLGPLSSLLPDSLSIEDIVRRSTSRFIVCFLQEESRGVNRSGNETSLCRPVTELINTSNRSGAKVRSAQVVPVFI